VFIDGLNYSIIVNTTGWLLSKLQESIKHFVPDTGVVVEI